MPSPFDPSRRVWRCPCCNTVNVWNYQDQQRLAESNIDAAISHGSCFDNICGQCRTNIVEADSPIMAECYSHQTLGETGDDPERWDSCD